MVKVKITFDRETCIGALACAAVYPEKWIPADDGKVDLKGSQLNQKENKFELILDVSEEEFEKIKGSADVCPVIAIKVERLN